MLVISGRRGVVLPDYLLFGVVLRQVPAFYR